MKCIRCQQDSKYPERKGRRCPKCKGAFAFEPREGDWMSDYAFHRAIDQVSAEGQVRWGVEHLYYEVMRRRRWRALGALFMKLFFVDTKLVRNSALEFAAYWDKWVKVHGQPDGVIVRRKDTPATTPVESDIGDYSFDRAVICDRARTVDVLLANNFHFENNCAVLSIDGYPKGPFETVRQMLKRNPKIKVYALHDATVAGCRLASRLARDPEWFGGSVPIIDVGLRPNHAKPFAGTLLRAPFDAVQDNDGITPVERTWLTKYQLELAAIRPEQVLKRLFRAMNKQYDPNETTEVQDHPDLDGGNSWFVWTDSDSFGTDAADSDGGGDSFG